ncbi:MAG: VIT1/CCC1 transporter family protein [Pseudomonadota bacterium]
MSAYEGWMEEKQSAWLYRQLARCETNEIQARLFDDLAQAAEEQSEIWAIQLRDAGQPMPAFRPSTRAVVVAHLARRLSPRAIRPVLAAMKVRGLSAYQGPSLSAAHPRPGANQQESWHRGYGGGALRAGVFGVNDGLVSNASLIMGVAGATAEAGAIITAGVAGLLAGALSMAAGEYISMRSQKEMYEYQIGLERAEIEAYPEEEAEELAQIYHARGMDLEQARSMARQMLQDPEHALDVLSREELGLNPEDLGSPWGAAAFSFVSFVAGALIPLLPYLLGAQGGHALAWAAGLAGVSLFAVGAALSLFTGRHALGGGLRMLLIGAGAGAVTYAIGALLGTQIG